MWNPLQILKKISRPALTIILVVIILMLCIWFVLPFIPINESYPFSTMQVRLTITALLVLAGLIWLCINFFLKHKSKTFSVLKEGIIKAWTVIKAVAVTCWEYSKEYYHDLHDRFKKEQKYRRIKRLPWYLILGTPQAGKHAIVQNTGLDFQRAEYLGEEAISYAKQFPDFEWNFAQQAILIDAMTGKPDVDADQWKKFTKLLKRERRGRPLNGIVLTFSLADLLLYSNKERQDYLQKLSVYIRDIYSHFKSFVPVYLVFNKCDLIEGFMEFFENLSKEELSQVWGMTLPIEQSNDVQFVLNFFNREYTGLIEQLRKRIMWAFDTEKSIRGRELVNAFPQQMQLFRKSIESFIVELFGTTRYQKALQLRGIYFTSCIQGQGQSHDFLLQAVSKKFQLVPPVFKRHARIGEPYFLRSLFFNVILPEAAFLGQSERRKKISKVFYHTCLIACPIIVLILGFGMHEGYLANKDNLQTIQKQIDQYSVNLSSLSPTDVKEADILPVLDTLEQARRLYTHSDSWGLPLLFASYHVRNTIANAEERALQDLLWPRVAARLESKLGQTIQDQNLLYAYLKGYLAFSDIGNTGQEALKAPMEYLWSQDYASDPDTYNKLRAYLDFASQWPIQKLPVDQNLINATRAQLKQISPEQRAYGLLSLRANVSSNNDISLPMIAGAGFADVFTSANPDIKISSLYTQAAFNNIFLPQYKSIAQEVAEDDRSIGLSYSDNEDDADSLANSLQDMYNKNYINAWNAALASVQVKPFANLDAAVVVLTTLTSKDSPMAAILNVVYNNTYNISHDRIDVEDQFSQINAYSKNHSWSASSQGTIKALSKVRDYLLQLQQDPNQNLASFNAAQAIIQGKQKNPMRELTELAAKSPAPVSRWLQALSANCWQVILQGAHQQMNLAWQSQVMSTYNTTMRGRYPFNSHSDADVSIDSFNNVFSAGGALDTYFVQYIKPFVNTDKANWSLYQLNGLDIGLPASSLAIFENAITIRNEFFPNNAKTAQFNITIQPHSLDNRASSIQLTIGPQTISYSYGPQMPAQVNWPITGETQNSQVILMTDAGQYSHEASGPWSLFKLLQYGELKPTGNDGTYLWKLNFDKYTASYDLTGPNDMSMFTLSNLKNYHLPDNIAPN